MLSGVLPAMERFVTRWEKMQATYPILSDIIDVGLQKVIEYYNKSYKQTAYPIAMGMFASFVDTNRGITEPSTLTPCTSSQSLPEVPMDWSEDEQKWATSVIKAKVGSSKSLLASPY